jgi:predicted site-specific integrase-resolvase
MYAQDKHFKIVKTYQDIGSGLNTGRKGLWRLIKDAKRGKFSHLVINYRDRLTRFGYRYLQQYLQEFGVTIRSINALDEASPNRNWWKT